MGKNDCASRLVSIINAIGIAGLNEIDMIDSLSSTEKFQYHLRLTHEPGEGKAYNYNDYTFQLESGDRHLTIKTVASYDEKERKYLTKIYLIYKLTDVNNYVFELNTYDVNGWSYQNLIDLDKKQFFEALDPFKNDMSFKNTVLYFKKAFTAPELDKVINELQSNIVNIVKAIKEEEEEVDETLESLTPRQKNILKKKLKYGK